MPEPPCCSWLPGSGALAARDMWNTRLWKPAPASAGLIGRLDADSGSAKWEPSRELGIHALRHTHASVQLKAGESVGQANAFV
ncbi:hypothetical protein ABZ330_34240 [Streptomyces sp. NPDC006172]|uniref:hypothetical protein n=1 Tax=Streptomyces sp. NPDC006172 TaxID=3154470 RepID=UPI0033C2DD91